MAAGRPKKEINYEMVKKLANIHCTQKEIASVLDLSVKTLQRDEEFCRIYNKGIEEGKSALRRMQWRSAEAGSDRMLIFLGKQYLGQSNKMDMQIADTTSMDELIKSIDDMKENENNANI